MKTCSTCKQPKEVTEFHKHKKAKDGLSTICKECAKAKAKEWAHANPERVKANVDAYRENNPEMIKEKKAEAYKKNSKKVMEKTRQWRLDNPEKYKEQNKRNGQSPKGKKQRKEYALTHPEEMKAYKEKSYQKNKAAHRLAGKEWSKNNAGKVNAQTAKRRCAQLQRTPAWLTKEDFKKIREFYIEARRLTEETGISHHVDHIIPLQGKNVSGLHVPSNLQILVGKENCSKGNKF